MSKRKKKSSAAENLIESLMDDVRGIQEDGSFHQNASESSEEPTNFHQSPSSDGGGDDMWAGLEKDVGAEIDASEFGSPADEYSSHEEEDDYTNQSIEEFASGDEMLDGEKPVGFDIPARPEYPVYEAPAEEKYQGPSSEGGYQAAESLDDEPSEVVVEMPTPTDDVPYVPASSAYQDDFTSPVDNLAASLGENPKEDKTVSIQDLNLTSSKMTGAGTDADRTLAVSGFANARVGGRKNNDVDVKVSVGNFRGSNRAGSANVMTSVDASLAQAENLKLAQQRILELEKEVEFLRSENEELASAGEIIRSRTDELGVRIVAVEKEKAEDRESFQSEILILKGNLQYKENEVAKARVKVEELETRLKSDFKKIRVRERELENRLELLRAEKAALVRSKDEYILDQKRKIDQLSQELDNYRNKCLELNKTIEGNQDQFKRTERALRLALSNLEVKDESGPVPLKKAE
ncbi:hypothetical protein B9G69_000530 [Bdellovibrio sp. SKB1291214]|uniref:hypothetical protein n=1 Tax=Bdellovibrio sp. SKB1291214 TaxID=1732569 RepID=UPI000B5197C9|nr:hypothetical protein [Bdellovibrio sp. SKB1291214]UYL09060.1 hypothetical protein B9G69_000530 [Bdellovibrio sp. SKB1291214]